MTNNLLSIGKPFETLPKCKPTTTLQSVSNSFPSPDRWVYGVKWEHPTICCTGAVNEDSAGRMEADQVVDEGQYHEQGSRQGQVGQTLVKRCYQVDWQVTLRERWDTMDKRCCWLLNKFTANVRMKCQSSIVNGVSMKERSALSTA
jgi:hypothetical protein